MFENVKNCNINILLQDAESRGILWLSAYTYLLLADMKCANETRTVCTILVLHLPPNQTALSYLSCCNLEFSRSVTQHTGLV